MRFLGLAAPGANGVSSLEDLVAVWRRKDKRFQNYRSIFTIFNEPVISWEWMDDMVDGIKPHDSIHCPATWKKWVDTGRINALVCASVPQPRSKKDQLPDTKNDTKILERIIKISDREFEYAARDILAAIDRRFTDFEITTRSRDGGRDLIGFYEIGYEPFLARLEVFVEAKKWLTTSGIGVKPVSRLISRLRHRDMGVFITTTYFDKQVQQEIIDDGHPVILISGKDIVHILKKADLAGPGYEKNLEDWLRSVAAIAVD